MTACPTYVWPRDDADHAEWVKGRAALMVAALRAGEYDVPHAPGIMEQGIMLMHRERTLHSICFNMLRDPKHDRSDVPELVAFVVDALEPSTLRFEGFDARRPAIPALRGLLDRGASPDGERWSIMVHMPTPWSAAATATRLHSSSRQLPVSLDPVLHHHMPMAARLVVSTPDEQPNDSWFLMPASTNFDADSLTDPMQTLRLLREIDELPTGRQA
jgi:hypothetical protein